MRFPIDPAWLARALPVALPALLLRGGCCPSSSGTYSRSIPYESLVQRSDGAVVIPPADAALTLETCVVLCEEGNPTGTLRSCRVLRADGGVQSVDCESSNVCYAGRAPPGLSAQRSDAADAVARFFADTQRLEAAAVDAFALLTLELAAHGAPADLVARSVSAEADERRHAAQMAALTTAAGGALLPFAATPQSPRGFAAMTLDNAVEGCARETWAAMVALHQARFAEDPSVRGAFAVIARDELAHAALSWDLARWCGVHASEATRRESRQAWRDALESLRPGDRAEDGFTRALGLPSAAASNALLDALTSAPFEGPAARV